MFKNLTVTSLALKITLVLMFLFISINLNAQMNYRRSFRDWLGRREWNNNNFEEAERHFRENAIENPNIGEFHFNRGTALYKQDYFEEAQREFQIALNDRNFEDRDQIFHNMGNIAFNTGDYEQALELFRRSLIENPDNIDSRVNFELTRQIIQQQEQESDGGGDSDENEEQEQQEQQQQQNQQEDQDRNESERILQAIEQMQEQERDREQQAPGQRRGRFW
ncbi:MAG: tetratricopeptide repeat protein [Candidatus Cloacimonetes bacterium]|nr:tetratricopeptide repeat protein [Candidatus Cloacimonadota bacterium]